MKTTFAFGRGSVISQTAIIERRILCSAHLSHPRRGGGGYETRCLKGDYTERRTSKANKNEDLEDVDANILCVTSHCVIRQMSLNFSFGSSWQ